MPHFSILIPARNEEGFLPRCLDSIKVAATPFPGQVEIIVALNRCTDRTEEIALKQGAKVVREDSRNLARIRNAAAKAATGEIIITIDADSRMTANMLVEIDRLLRTGKYVGGGVTIRPERWSLGILVTVLLLAVLLLWRRVSGGCFGVCGRISRQLADSMRISSAWKTSTSPNDSRLTARAKENGSRRSRRLTSSRRAASSMYLATGIC